MAAGAALALLSLPDMPPPDSDAPSAVLRARMAAAAGSTTPSTAASQPSMPDCYAEPHSGVRSAVTQQLGVKQRQVRSSLWRAVAAATALSLFLSAVSAWWLGSTAANL